MPKERVCANGRALSRRSLLAAMPAAGASFAFTASAEASTDPILPFYHQWREAWADWNRLANIPGNEDWEWPESLAAEERAEDALRKMAALTPTTREGIAACAHAVWHLIGPDSASWAPDFQRELELPEFKLLASIWRAADGAGLYPGSPALPIDEI